MLVRKYYFGYLVFLLPALIVSLVFNNDSTLSIILQWFFGFFMLFGFGVNTAAASYRYPRNTMSFILFYTGLNLLISTLLYSSSYGTLQYTILRRYAGALSFVPLEIMVDAILDFNVPHEVYITLLVTACCLIGLVFGLVRRRVSPNPYRPTIG